MKMASKPTALFLRAALLEPPPRRFRLPSALITPPVLLGPADEAAVVVLACDTERAMPSMLGVRKLPLAPCLLVVLTKLDKLEMLALDVLRWRGPCGMPRIEPPDAAR